MRTSIYKGPKVMKRGMLQEHKAMEDRESIISSEILRYKRLNIQVLHMSLSLIYIGVGDSPYEDG